MLFNMQNVQPLSGIFQNLAPDCPVIKVLGPTLSIKLCWASPKQNMLSVGGV